MTNNRYRSITPCFYERGVCTSFSAGHNTHTVQATLAGTEPRGWSRAVVEEVDGLRVTLSGVGTEGRLVIWHHRALESLHVGSVVRMHTGRSLIEISARWVSVQYFEG